MERRLALLLELQAQVKSVREWRRLEVVWLREKLRLSGAEVAVALNYRLQTVHYIWHQWRREAEGLFERPGPGGRKHAYLTSEEEVSFLSPFLQQGADGGLLTVASIQEAYEKLVGKPVSPSTIYRLLHRHGWRKVMPRKRHPNSDPEQQEQAKKN